MTPDGALNNHPRRCSGHRAWTTSSVAFCRQRRSWHCRSMPTRP